MLNKLNAYIRLEHFARMLLILLPPLLLCILSLLSHNNCFVGHPVWPDELEYWRHVYSFSESPDKIFGYFGTVGYPAKIGQLGWHGLSSLLVYGVPALLFGWELNSIVICNMIYCMLAFLGLVLIAKPTPRQCLLIAILWFCYVPITLYAPSSWMEMPQYALLIFYMALLARIAKDDSTPTIKWIAFLVVFFMSALRISNIVFYLPLILFLSRFRVSLHLLKYVCICAALSLLSYWFFGLFSSTYPGSFLHGLFSSSGSASIVRLLQNNILNNLHSYFSFSENLITDLQRYCMLIVLLIWVSIFCYRLIRFKKAPANCLSQRTLLTCVLTLLASMIIVIAIYDVHSWRDYRTWAPIFWSLLLFGILVKLPRIATYPQMLCIVLTLAITAPVIPGTIVPRAFEWSRYRELTINPDNEVASLIEPLGIYPEDRTIIVDHWDMKEPFMVFDLDPSIGILLSRKGVDSSQSNIAYIFTNTQLESADNYEIIWHSDYGYLYKRNEN